MRVRLAVAPKMRCDIVTYAGVNLTGRRASIRIWPSGSIQGGVSSEDLGSMVIRAPHGTRVILATADGSNWEASPWRCIRLVPGFTVPSEDPNGFPGVRVPDLDLLDPPSSRRAQADLQSSYPLVERLEEGTDWTFGRTGSVTLKDHVVLIRVERDQEAGAEGSPDDAPQERVSDAQRVARALLERALEVAPDAVADLALAARAVLSPADALALEMWLDRQRG